MDLGQNSHDSGPLRPGEYAWIAIACCFLAFLADTILYTSIAACAVVSEWLWPCPGTLRYEHCQSVCSKAAHGQVFPADGPQANTDVETQNNPKASPIPGVSQHLIDQYERYPMVLVQVGDDSVHEDCRKLVDEAVAKVQAQGHPVQLFRRTDRTGYKAGNLLAGLKEAPKVLTEPVEYVAILDADFEPPVDFLYQTIYHMEKDATLGFVQGCWTHANRRQNWLTWFQAHGLDIHFAIEQRARGFVRTFFGFNGTAGVWRLKCMDETGGWSVDTTVEDMDLSIRAFCLGWKFKYLHHVKLPSELPATIATYRTQQYRWQSGPMQVAKKCLYNVWASTKLSVTAKLSASWFFLRYACGFIAVAAGAAIIPMLLFATRVTPWRYAWPEIFLLVASNTYAAMYILFTPIGFIPYAFINACISYYRIWCQLMGVIGTEKSKSWKVTNKTGGQTNKPNTPTGVTPPGNGENVSSITLKNINTARFGTVDSSTSTSKTKSPTKRIKTKTSDDSQTTTDSSSSFAQDNGSTPATTPRSLMRRFHEQGAVIVEITPTIPKKANEAPAPAPNKSARKGKAYILELIVSLYYLTFAGVCIWYHSYILMVYCLLMFCTLVLISTTDLWATTEE